MGEALSRRSPLCDARHHAACRLRRQ